MGGDTAGFDVHVPIGYDWLGLGVHPDVSPVLSPHHRQGARSPSGPSRWRRSGAGDIPFRLGPHQGQVRIVDRGQGRLQHLIRRGVADPGRPLLGQGYVVAQAARRGSRGDKMVLLMVSSLGSEHSGRGGYAAPVPGGPESGRGLGRREGAQRKESVGRCRCWGGGTACLRSVTEEDGRRISIDER